MKDLSEKAYRGYTEKHFAIQKSVKQGETWTLNLQLLARSQAQLAVK